jgi:hypothetical protein
VRSRDEGSLDDRRAPLRATAQLRARFEALVTRYPRMRLPEQTIAWRSNTILRGPRELSLEV